MFNTDKSPRTSISALSRSGDSHHRLLADGASERSKLVLATTRCKWTRDPWHMPCWVHAVIFAVYTCVFVALVLPWAPAKHLPLPSPEGLIWENRKFPTSIVDNPFTGSPRPELDAAWHELLKNDNILVPRGYLDQKGLRSVYTKDGKDGVASLSIHHSLHCLKKVRRMLFKEHYHQGKTAEAMTREEKHVDHCVEYIREALMCQPDLSLVTFRWINNTAQHPDNKSAFWPTNFDADTHKCASWEALDAWASRRAFNLFELDKLDRPVTT